MGKILTDNGLQDGKAMYEKLYGRKLTSEETNNLKHYGAVSAAEYAPEPDDLAPGQCVCGAFECGEEYAHHTSGW